MVLTYYKNPNESGIHMQIQKLWLIAPQLAVGVKATQLLFA